jgi:hypothetical protein
MPSVPVKRVEQQALVALHRVREQWMTTWTARINTLRGILREPGLLLPAGARAAVQPVRMLLEETKPTLPPHLRTVLTELLAAQRRRAAAPPLTRLHHWALTVRDRRGHIKRRWPSRTNWDGPCGRSGIKTGCSPCRTPPNGIMTFRPRC